MVDCLGSYGPVKRTSQILKSKLPFFRKVKNHPTFPCVSSIAMYLHRNIFIEHP